MVHHNKPNTLAFGNLFKLLKHNTGNDVEKFPKKPTLLNLLETSQNPSLMHPSQTTSLAKVLHPSRRTTLALPRATLLYPRNPLPIFCQRWQTDAPGTSMLAQCYVP